MVRTAWSEDFPWGTSPEQAAAFQSLVREAWGNDDAPAQFLTVAHGPLGALTDDPGFRRYVARVQRNAMSPGEYEAFDRVWMDTDVRDILPSIQAPTVVLHRAEGEEERGLCAAVERAIPGAMRKQLPGMEFVPFLGDVDAVVDAVASHLRVERPMREHDRVLASILFTDIVGSTQQAATLGDWRWRQIIVEHERRAREVLARHRGVFEHTTGDGLMARFDGPARAVRCAQKIAASMQDLSIQIRAGVHTGEIELTETGAHGLGVHVAARVAAMAGASEVWTSSTVKDLVAGSGLTFEDAGEHELKGVPDRWHLYRVVNEST
jgi:class 3 adenylate cyclase